jgi:hypothetical protein
MRRNLYYAKVQRKSPFHPPLAKRGKRGILPNAYPADAVQNMLGVRMKQSNAKFAKVGARFIAPVAFVQYAVVSASFRIRCTSLG